MRAERDTDADWRVLGETQPYWGVLTHPDYRTENLTPANLEAFYGTGRTVVAELVGKLEAFTGARPQGPALDFGCGAGRLTEAMAEQVGEAVGYDISPGMLEEARKRAGRARYVDALPDGPFGWINSFIVFQHIPPARGMAILDDLLARLQPGGHLSLHVTVWREPHLEVPPAEGWRRLTRPWMARRNAARLQPGTILMYDYDLSAIVKALNLAGISELGLSATDHDGHHGVVIFGRKPAKPHA